MPELILTPQGVTVPLGSDHFNDITIAGTMSIGAQSTVEGDLKPDTDDNRDLGAFDKRWRNLYLKGDVNFPSKTANTVFSGPASGAAASPAFRTLVDADIPNTISLDNLTQIATRNHSDLAGVTSDQHHAQAHVLATTAGLGTDHSTSGLTAGQVLRATGATAAAFQTIQDSDLPTTITRDSEVPASATTQAANAVFSGPSSGGAVAPTFRALVDNDIPNTITLDSITQITSRAISDTTGTLAVNRGGTGQTTQTAAFDALDPLTTKGDVLANNGTNSIRLAVGANDQVLTADSAQASGVKWADAGGGLGYAISGGTTSVHNPADLATRFFGFSGIASTIADIQRMYIPKAGNITRWDLFVHTGGTLSTSTATYSLRLNNTSDNLSIVLDFTPASGHNSATGSIAVVAGDYLEIKQQTGSLGPNPTTVKYAWAIYIE